MITANQLTIYLQDHHAGAKFGTELARRARDENQDTPYGDFLIGLAQQIEDDARELETIMAKLDVGPDHIKDVVSWTSEKLGRLKLNGRIFGYAPLSRVLELEGLLAGVRGKLALWHSLRELAATDPRLDVAPIDRLIERAERQLETLREHHARAARDAFSSP